MRWLQPGLSQAIAETCSRVHVYCVVMCVSCVVRCKVRAYDQASHTFYLLNQDGSLPSRQYVQMGCQVRAGVVLRFFGGWRLGGVSRVD